MKKWARINRGRVAEITDIDPTGRFHPSIVWEPVSGDVKPGMVKDGIEYRWPVPDIGDVRASAIQRIEAGYRQALKSFTHADATWDASDDRATVLRDLLNRLANGRGLPRGKETVTLRDTTGATQDMTAGQVIDLGEAGSDHRDECLEIRMALLDQIRDAETADVIEAIDWPALD